MAVVIDKNELLECPYEKSHRILKFRMQVHLVKCERNHENVPKVRCPFNVTHVLNDSELEYHVTDCRERKTFENYYNVDETVTTTVPPPMPVNESEENWDNDDAPTYNASEYVAKAAVVRNIQGVAPAVRKQFRKMERLRLLGY